MIMSSSTGPYIAEHPHLMLDKSRDNTFWNDCKTCIQLQVEITGRRASCSLHLHCINAKQNLAFTLHKCKRYFAFALHKCKRCLALQPTFILHSACICLCINAYNGVCAMFAFLLHCRRLMQAKCKVFAFRLHLVLHFLCIVLENHGKCRENAALILHFPPLLFVVHASGIQ